MQQRDFELALQAARQQSKQRRFVQSVEMIINFKGLDIKKPESQLDIKLSLPFSAGKKGVGKSLLFAKDRHFISEMQGKVDRIIDEHDIPKLSKKDVDAIISEFDSIIAEGPVTLTVGRFLGQQLAPKGKMPKPVHPNAAQAAEAIRQLGEFVRVTNKKGKVMPTIQLVVGSEKMQDSQIGSNAAAVLEAVVRQLPRKEQNLKSVFLKLTMGPPAKVGPKEKEAGKK